ncbi:hypothetical protein ES332_D01G271000v1 [Gossypium tomentosum]|uniref:Anaphase-promoting complex subunit 4 WD40 domain-containing protein n=1 Tax=Gossypium tomentosum TaxID=34277 RepID=A0A5D2ME44_GOSTO|nr:hypothetical protein ES332_D01G271000v1 [Gossypium tomentosum]
MEPRKLERRKTMTMNWDGLGDDDDEFFEPSNRVSSAVPRDSTDEDSDDFDDCRHSFSSNGSPIHRAKAVATVAPPIVAPPIMPPMSPNYDIWKSSPGSIKHRRQQLFQGMGLSANKELLSFKHLDTNKVLNGSVRTTLPPPPPPPPKVTTTVTTDSKDEKNKKDGSKESKPRSGSVGGSRSDGEMELLSIEKKRKKQLLGSVSKQSLRRTSSLMSTPRAQSYPNKEATAKKASTKDATAVASSGSNNNNNNNVSTKQNDGLTSAFSDNNFEAFFLIKNLDNGKEFIVNEFDQDGMWNKLSDIQTGKQLTMDEFEKSVGYSPVVKDLMSRDENVNRMVTNQHGSDRKLNSYFSKSLKVSKKRGAAVLKSIKGVATSMTLRGEKEKEQNLFNVDQKKNNGNSNNNQWVKVRQTGKSYKELSALHLCQEIQAHEGSIWSIKFSTNARFLASAGEDTMIYVWEVQECEVKPMNEACSSPEDKKKKGKGSSSSKKGNQVPNYVHAPETVFSLSDKPICSFKGHLDDVLDLSWSRSQQLLSSSMDKTVRLWDLDTKSCLKLFAHNDYVTCIHFNPMDDDYFISGSLDTKVRIWNIPKRQVVDWTDINEMVTAVCYTPDGQGAIIGTHKGSCRVYSTEDCRLTQLDQITTQNKKKDNAKKITGFQYCPINPTELLITSADSRIRVLDGPEVFYKFKGFKNTNSQIAATFTSDGTYVISASEDSQVFIWRTEEPRNTGTGKRSVITARGHEYFPCKDVSVAIPWPGTIKSEPLSMTVSSHLKRNPKSLQVPNGESPTKNDHNKKILPFPPLPKKKSNHHLGKIITDEDGEMADSMSRSSTASASSRSSSVSNDDSSSSTSTSSMSRSSTLSGASNLNSSGSNRASGSIRYGDSPSVSSFIGSSPWSWFNVSSHGHNAAAWGLVIVTATLSGEIRIYQNFGLPRRVSRL